MLRDRLATFFARSLCFVIAATSITACSGSGNSSTLPQATNGSAVPTLDATAPTLASTSSDGTVSDTTAYTWHGCQVYPANDWFTTDLIAGGSSYVPNTVDPNSEKIIANLNAAYPNATFNGSASTFTDETVNVATNSTPTYRVRSGTMKDDPYNDNPNGVIPWQDSFYTEGTGTTCQRGYDCHSIVVNTDTCVTYETYGYGTMSWNKSTQTFIAPGGGYTHNLNHPFNDQYSSDGGDIGSAGLPMLGETDLGEDAALPSINHIVEFLTPGRAALNGYVAPATNKSGCSSYCANALPYGGRLRLHASYPCPSASTNPQANLVCNQLKHYGTIATDNLGGGGNYAFRFGTTSNGVNPWNTSDLEALLNNLHITDFDVMTLGAIR